MAPVADVHILGPGLITNGGLNAFSAGVLFFAEVTQSEVNGITVLGSSFAGIDADFGGLGNSGAGVDRFDIYGEHSRAKRGWHNGDKRCLQHDF